MDANKEKALAAALGQIEKQFGKGSIMRLGDGAAAMLANHAERWDWAGLSQNEVMPWSQAWVEAFADHWDWERLSANPALFAALASGGGSESPKQWEAPRKRSLAASVRTTAKGEMQECARALNRDMSVSQTS